MNIKDLRKQEFETTLRVLRAYPEDKANLRPAPKSRSAIELAATLASEEMIIEALLKEGRLSPDMSKVEMPEGMSAAIELWQKAVSNNEALLATLNEEDLNREVDFYGNPMSLKDAIFGLLCDHIHHRGQFSVYLRIADAKVPSIYGPTADEPWNG